MKYTYLTRVLSFVGYLVSSKSFLIIVLGCLALGCSDASPSSSSVGSLDNLNSIEELSDDIESHVSTTHQKSSSLFHVINECVVVSTDEGIFHYKSKGSENTCGLYFLADPDKTITINIDYLDVQCHQNGLISIVDGWELNGQLFPSVEDHEKNLQSRFHEFCGRRKIRQSFHSSQNAAVIQYRIPMFGQGFSVRVQHVFNPRPCNILVNDTSAFYTLQNFGRHINCSLMTLFDAKIRPLYMSSGLYSSSRSTITPGYRTGIFHKCSKLGLTDYVQLGGSSGIDTSKMEVVDEFCGHDSSPVEKYTIIFCGMTTVRLVSGGKFHNKIVVEIQKAEIDDFERASYMCDL